MPTQAVETQSVVPSDPASRSFGLPVSGAALLIAAVLLTAALLDGGASLTFRSVAAILAWWAVIGGLMFGILPRAHTPRAAVVTGLFLGALVLWCGLSMAWAPSAEHAFEEVDRLAFYAGVFTLALLVTRHGDAARWADGLAVGIGIVVVLALLQRLVPGLLPSDPFPPELVNAQQRLRWPLGYWNGLAILLGMGVPLLLRAALASDSVVWRVLAVTPLPLIAAAIYLSSSRGGAAAAGLGAILFLALTAWRLAAVQALAAAALGGVASVLLLRAHPELVEVAVVAPGDRDTAALVGVALVLICVATGALFAAWSRVVPPSLELSRGVRVLGAGVLGVGVVAALVAVDPLERLRRFQDVGVADPSSPDYVSEHFFSGAGSGRWQIWSSAFDQFAEHPVGGQGAGSFESWWAQHGTLAMFVRNAHSLWLETLGELGLVGGVLLAGAFVAASVAGVRRLRGATPQQRVTVAALLGTTGAFVLGAGIDWVWELPVIACVAVVCLALLAGPATLAPARAPGPGRPRGTRYAAGAALVLVGWIAIVGQGVLLTSTLQLRASERAAARGDLGAARDAADAARAIQPWAAAPYVQLALLAEQAGDPRAALEHIREATRRDRSDWRLQLITARLATTNGDIASARRALAETRRLNPRSARLQGIAAPP